MHSLAQLRYSARSFLRTPGLLVALLLTIALGIGCNAAVYGFVRGLLSRDLPPHMAVSLVRVGRLLAVAAAAVLFMACANIATFLLGRTASRSHETSVRIALGARRSEVAAQLLADVVVIAIPGAACGLLLAAWTMSILPALFYDQDAAQLSFTADVAAIAGSTAVCAGIAIACGLLPLAGIRFDQPAAVLRRESAGPSKALRRLRRGLVVGQMSCCCMFVIAAGLLLDGFRGALQTNIGVGQRRPLLATVQAKPLGESAYFRDVERAARSIPEVAEAAWVSAPPGGWQVSQRLRVEPAQLPLRDVSMHVAAFTKEALAFITLPAIAGRVFGGGDTPDSCRVAVVDDEAATRLFGGEAVGRSIEEPGGRHVEIIGVVRVVPRRPGPTIFYYPAQVADLPGGSGPQIFRVPDRSALAEVVLDATVVSPRYFGLMGWPWMASSGQPGADTEPAHASSWPSAASCRVAVVNQQAASAAFGGRAVGAAVIDGDARRTDIVGVIGARPLGTFHAAIGPAIYLPLAQEAPRRMTLILAAADGAVLDLEAVRQRLDAVPGRAVDPDVPVVVKTLDTHLRHTSLAPLRIATVLVGAFAATALLLGGLGLYGALSEAARQRQRETAMRRALGAKGWRLISHMLDEGGRLAAKGAAAGLLGSVGVSRWLSAIAPVSAAPAAIWLAGPLTLLAMLALASLLPARRAMTVDPLTLLRDS